MILPSTLIKLTVMYQIELLKFGKQNFYQTGLSTNQKSPEKLWKTINELLTTNKTELVIPDKLNIGVNNDTVTHPQNIA